MWDFDEDSFITLTDENGNEVDFLLLDVMEHNGSDYLVLLPLTDESDEGEEDEEDEEALLFLLTERNQDGERYSSIADEALLEELAAAYEALSAERLRARGISPEDEETL